MKMKNLGRRFFKPNLNAYFRDSLIGIGISVCATYRGVRREKYNSRYL